MTISKDWEKVASVCRNNRWFYFNKNKSVWVSQRGNDWEVSMLTANGYLQMFTASSALKCINAFDSVKGAE